MAAGTELESNVNVTLEPAVCTNAARSVLIAIATTEIAVAGGVPAMPGSDRINAAEFSNAVPQAFSCATFTVTVVTPFCVPDEKTPQPATRGSRARLAS